ncbi:MAG: M28 family peptidase [Vulcanimicrobiota bacterium]
MRRWLLWPLLSSLAWAQPPLLSQDMPGKSHSGPLPRASAHQRQLAVRLRADVTHLAVEIGERNSVHAPAALAKTRDWIRGQLVQAGYVVRDHIFHSGGRTFTNLECELPGQTPELILVGAHYDSAEGCPAANDNGSGVASLLALARYLKSLKQKPGRTIRLVAFCNEEPPHFWHESMGSLQYARMARKRGDRITAMLSLETMGYYSDKPGSQKFPVPLGLSYPDTGNYIVFVGNLMSGPLVRKCVGSFRKHQPFPSQGAALPGEMEGVGWSDHWSFWEIGVPAVMVTDTAPMRYPYYHRPGDLPDKLDFGRLARVVEGLEGVLLDLTH